MNIKYKILIVILLLSILIFFLLFFYRNNEEIIVHDHELNISNIMYIENLNFEYYDTISLSNVINLQTGLLINQEIDTSQLGDYNIDIFYYIDNTKYKAKFMYTVVDTTKPLILNASSYSVKLGNDIDFLDKILVADNYDKKAQCSILGSYDVYTIGTYSLSIKCTDSSNNTSIENFNLYVKETIDTYTYESTKVYFEDVINTHKNSNTLIGIDVSHWQGDINWHLVKDAGCDFAIIRVGYAPGNDVDFFIDTKFLDNLNGAKDAGIDVGLYYFSYADSTEEAIEHAEYIVNLLDGMPLELPISFDWENWSSFNSYNLSLVDINNMAIAFIDTVESYGYKGMNYGSANYLRNIWNIEHTTWLAHYTTQTNYEDDYYIWQLTDTGIINGIDSYVDINVLYK